MSGDVIQASDRLRVDAQDEAGSGCLATPEAGLLKPSKQGQNDLRAPIFINFLKVAVNTAFGPCQNVIRIGCVNGYSKEWLKLDF